MSVIKLPSNATAKEIIDNIRIGYPNLGPVLQQLLDLADNYQPELDLLIEGKDIEDDDDSSEDPVEAFVRETNEEGRCKCQHCGSTVQVPQPSVDNS